MSFKIELLFLSTPLLFLLILLMLLLMFCFMQHYIYKSQSIMYNDSDLEHNIDSRFNDKINKINNLKDKEIKKNINFLSNIVKESKNKLQENFENIPVDDLQSNLDTLKTLEDNITDFEAVDLVNIKKTMALIKKERMANKAKIIDLLSNLYILASLDTINKGNAAAYKEYVTYQNPKQNIFYKQYI
jgi:hypothetical protein